MPGTISGPCHRYNSTSEASQFYLGVNIYLATINLSTYSPKILLKVRWRSGEEARRKGTEELTDEQWSVPRWRSGCFSPVLAHSITPLRCCSRHGVLIAFVTQMMLSASCPMAFSFIFQGHPIHKSWIPSFELCKQRVLLEQQGAEAAVKREATFCL